MLGWRKHEYPNIFLGLALAFAALIVLLDSFGTMDHHLAIGLLTPILAALLLIILALAAGSS